MTSSKTITDYVQLINKFKNELEKPFIGRSEEALVITLALMVSEHVILVGEPGTAKSALARRAADLVRARFFKYLLTKYTEPDELLGPLDVVAFREGRYVRVTRNKLPDSEIAFLDEIFNASSAILNTLLTLMNERVIYDGYNEINVPLWTLISASNSTPEEPELQAIYDRFLLRHFVRPVGEDKWINLLEASWLIEREGYRAPSHVLTMDDLKEIYREVLKVDISKIKEKLVKIYAIIEDQGIHITDRRKGKALKVIAAHAFLNGRKTALEEDLIVLKYIAPGHRDEADRIHYILLEELGSRERILAEISEIDRNIRQVLSYVRALRDFDPKLIEYLRGLERARDKLRYIVDSTLDDSIKSRAMSTLQELELAIDEIRKRLTI